jgi:hypothetical protein
MTIRTRLRTAAQIALGAIALTLIVATPAAPPAFADGQPPAPTTPGPKPPSGPLRTARPDPRVLNSGSNTKNDAGHLIFWYQIQNIGAATSKPILVATYCSYMLPGGTAHEVAAAPVKVVPPLASQAAHPQMTVDCAPWYGQPPAVARVLIVSEGDENTNNNQGSAHMP